MTKPDSTIDTLATQTLADGSFNTSKEYLPGSYVAKAHIDADARYKAADSLDVPFVIGLEDRSITLDVSVG